MVGLYTLSAVGQHSYFTIASKLLSQTSSDSLETLNLLRTQSTDVAGLSRQLSQLIQTVASLPDRSDRIEGVSQSLKALESKWDGN
jgi:hypothetical protein